MENKKSKPSQKKTPEPVFISCTDQYIIDSARTIRYNLGLSQQVLSNRAEINSLVGQAEGISTGHKYSDYHLQDIIDVFNEEAMRINEAFRTKNSDERLKDDYTVYDLYPPTRLPDELVLKSINVISDKIFPTGALNYIIEELEFLNKPKTALQTTEFANELFNSNWKPSEFGKALDVATARGLLAKTNPPGVTYVKVKG